MGAYWSKQNQDINALDLIWCDISHSINHYKIYKNVYNLFLYDQSQCYYITHEQSGDSIIFIKDKTEYLIKYSERAEVECISLDYDLKTKLLSQLDNNSFTIKSGDLSVNIEDYVNSNYPIVDQLDSYRDP